MQINGIRPPSPPQERAPGLDMQRCIFIQAHSMGAFIPKSPYRLVSLTIVYCIVIALVLLHRGFFGQVLEENTDLMQSRFSPSILATYNSALRVIFALQAAYLKHPVLTRRFGMLWSNAFSASVCVSYYTTFSRSYSFY